ncbi:MAG: UDP-N-acetylmuramoyl-L-alanine--D-glutamate ligase [Fusobacteriaceae bacterium]|jgi:UDP-N-acetylmuramoylalanine--D-glutamate ligase|nr:UDP-N-acetylmuramoyl-L-alanine--D-glutamate ligase [Fusobacteriaceae bacterium]
MKKAMVFGAGLSGRGAEKLLLKDGYSVLMVDDKESGCLSSSKAQELLDGVDLFIKSPGIPYVPLVQKALEKDIPVINEIELAYRYKTKHGIRSTIIAVTGTNGKTTVTTKIAELLQTAGYNVACAGNVGASWAELLTEDRSPDYTVLELSSFQLENIRTFRADIAMIINLTPDHLERYGNVSEYYETKFRVTNAQRREDLFLLNLDSPEILKIFAEKGPVESGVLSLSRKDPQADYHVEDGLLRTGDEIIFDCGRLALKGEHNLENALFIAATAKTLGVKNEIIADFLYHTGNVEHRMEVFYRYGKITFINDSKGTNIEASRFAIEACPGCVLICGGHDKKLDWAPLADLIKARVKTVYLIGENADILRALLLRKGYGEERIHSLHTLRESLRHLRERCVSDRKQTVLLSPATSSYDQFTNFEERGRRFKELVQEIFR